MGSKGAVMSENTSDVEARGGSRSGSPGILVEDSRGVEEAREQRLLKLFMEQVREHGRERVAEMLQIDPRTVSATLKRGVLSRRVRTALERTLGQEEPRSRKDESACGQRLEALEREARNLRKATVAGFKALRDGQAQGLERLEARVARLEARLEAERGQASPPEGESVIGGSPSQVRAQKTVAAAADGPQARQEPERQRDPEPEPWTPPREYPDLVTEEAAPDDEQVYGAAWPLVEEWRRLRAVHRRPGRGLEWLRREERVLELEVAMLDEHRLTLPPATFPKRGVWRHGQLNWRWKALERARRARRRARVRHGLARAAVLGLLLGVAGSMVLVNGGM